MAMENVNICAFNRGIISPRGLARTDLKRTALSAETMTNWTPHVLGSMTLRAGTGYTTGTDGNNQSITIPFVYSGTDLARLEITNQKLRPLINDQPITRVSVATALTNPSFAAYLTNANFDGAGTGWTFGAGWAGGGGIATATLSNASVTQNSAVALVVGKSYSITYTITRSAGSVKASVGGTLGTLRNASGTYTETIIAGATQVIGFTGTGFSGTVDTLSFEPLDVDWQDKDETGATSTETGLLTLVGTGGSAAIREQLVTVAGGDQNKEHAVRIVVARGPVYMRIGSTSGADDYRTESLLGTGTHSIAFTPTGASVYIRFFCYDLQSRIITSCTIESAGIVTIPSPWLTADLPSIRWQASADVTYVACFGYQQRKIERRSTNSWSVVLYEPQDGPFRLQNDTITQLTASAITGDITLTANKQLFKATQVGGLFKISSIGQVVDTSFAADNLFSNPIKVTGRSTQRSFTITLSGTYSATLTLQRSVGDIGAWVDVPGHTAITAAGTTTYTDGLTDQIIYYRVGVKTGNYTSGTLVTELNYDAGSIDGIVKITAYTDAMTVSASVLQPLGSTDPSALWKEGSWSDYRGWPSEIQLHEGRLFFFGYSKVWGSLPDSYESYDESVIGDSGPINRSYGKGPVDKVMWTASLQRLLIGGEIAEWSVRSDGFDSPLTPANMTIRSPSTIGGANVRGVQIDSRCIFVNKSGNKLYEMNMADQGGFLFDYQSVNLSETCPELTLPGISRIAVQRAPDTRIHCVLADGTVAVLISQPAEDVTAWLLFSLPGGFVEDACVMPGTVEDTVYYTVKRTIQGATVRYHERFALQMTECQGGTLNKQMDSFVTYTGGASATITAAHLKGETLCIWGDGKDLGTAVANASTGVVTIPNGVTASNIVAGLPYTATFKSSKLAYAAQAGTALSIKKRIDSLSLICYNTHFQGLKYGRDFTTMFDLPQLKSGAPIAADTVHAALDVERFDFPGAWDSDARLCLKASSPRPCTVLGAIMGMTTNG